MSFGSLQEFLAMGGHGLYVWLCYGAALIIIVYNIVSVRVASRRFFQEARDRQRRHGGTDRALAGAGAGGADAATGESTRS